MQFFEAGKAFFGARQYLKAAGCFKKSLQKKEEGAQSAVFLAWCCAMLGLPARASALLARRFRKDAQYGMCCLDLGRAWEAAGSPAEARRWYETSLLPLWMGGTHPKGGRLR